MSTVRWLVVSGLLCLATSGCMSAGLWQTQNVDFKKTGKLQIMDQAVCEGSVMLRSREGRRVTVFKNDDESIEFLQRKLANGLNWREAHYRGERVYYSLVDYSRCPSNLLSWGHYDLMYEEHDGLANHARWATNGIENASFSRIDNPGVLPVYECVDNRDGFWKRTGRIVLTPFAVALDAVLSPAELIGLRTWLWICHTTQNMFR